MSSFAHVSEIGGLLVVPGWQTTHGNPVAIQHGQDGLGQSVFTFVEVWTEPQAVSSLWPGRSTVPYRTLGDARKAADKLLGRSS